MRRLSQLPVVIVLVVACGGGVAQDRADAGTDQMAQVSTDQVAVPEYRLVEDWISAPEDIQGTSAVTIDDDGNILAFRRDVGNVWIIDPEGKLTKEWGQDIAMWTHGIRVDPEGNIWTVDGAGHQIKKWSSGGSELLMTLGEYDVAGDDGEHFNRPTDVAFGPNGDFYISDGYVNTRVAKFAANGRFIKAWGDPGSEGPGQFNTVHSILIDRRDRVLVADRNNARVQIFDLEGNFIEMWTHLGSPYSLWITEDDILYIGDGVNSKVWIADAETGEQLGAIEGTEGVHWVAVDQAGSVYVASNRNHYLHKYEPVPATN